MNTYGSFIRSLNDVETFTWWALVAAWSVGIWFYIALKYIAHRQCREWYRKVDAESLSARLAYLDRIEIEKKAKKTRSSRSNTHTYGWKN